MADFGKPDHPNARRPRHAAGPFEGYRLGTIDVPVLIHQLSVDGCLVEPSFGAMGNRVRLQIDLPGEGWITVQCEVLPLGGRYGFAVRFVNLDDETRRKVERTITRALGDSPDKNGLGRGIQ